MPTWFSAANRGLSPRHRRPTTFAPPVAPTRDGGRAPGGRLPRPAALEPLEGRRLFAVSLDAAGFTAVTPEAGDRVVYVSSSRGDDGNSGLSAASPVRTLGRGKKLLRAGTGDQLRLRRGDRWYESLGYWPMGGASAARPMVIGAYGDGDRPVLATGNAVALTTGSVSGRTVNHLVVQGIKFYAHTRDKDAPTFDGGYKGGVGLRLAAATNDMLLEDCAVDGYQTNVSVQNYFGPASNVRVRRCQITDAYNRSGGHAQGLYAEGVSHLTLDGNVFDHNGWAEGLSGAGRTMYNHNVYVKENATYFAATGNVFANAGSHGLQARSGGNIDDNTFLNNPIHLSFGMVNGSPVRAGGVGGRVDGNVFMGGGAINGTQRGWAIEVANVRPGGTSIRRNVFANAPAGSGYAIYLSYGNGVSNQSQAVGINDLRIEDNVFHNWARGVFIDNKVDVGGPGYKGLNNLSIRNNRFQRMQSSTILYVGDDFTTADVKIGGNRYHTSAADTVWVNVGGPAKRWAEWSPGRDVGSSLVTSLTRSTGEGRTAGTYAGKLGLGSTDSSYLGAARRQSATSWNPALLGSELAEYVRSGFGV